MTPVEVLAGAMMESNPQDLGSWDRLSSHRKAAWRTRAAHVLDALAKAGWLTIPAAEAFAIAEHTITADREGDGERGESSLVSFEAVDAQDLLNLLWRADRRSPGCGCSLIDPDPTCRGCGVNCGAYPAAAAGAGEQ